jgi:hypothetical protein
MYSTCSRLFLPSDMHDLEQGEKAIDTFLTSLQTAKKLPKLPKTVRAMIRNIQPYLPQAATTNRVLAKACFLTSPMNYMCRHHQSKAKRQGKIDGQNTIPGEYKVTGVAYEKILVSKHNGYRSEPGFFSCGCSEDDVLMDFFFWKTWVITSPTTQVTEGWLGQTLEPRTRAFITTAFREMQMVSLDEMYSGDRSYTEQRQVLLTLMIQRLSAELESLTAYEDRVAECEV